MDEKAKKLLVRGIVQGVGFRPFVYCLAVELGLVGWVKNGGNGVWIVIQGTDGQLSSFLSRLKTDKPPLAKIDSVRISNIPATKTQKFEIFDSEQAEETSTFIPSDITICKACEIELSNPANRRYRYPLTNCAHCGPRYTIIESLPYDRAGTSMKAFTMCDECKSEYHDPTNRRFHAEPISCPKCGPTLTLKDGAGLIQEPTDMVEAAAKLIKDGKIGAIKGLGGFHLICDATNEKAVQTLRERKRRPKKPFAVMFGSLEEVKANCDLNKTELKILTGQNRPIVLLNKHTSCKLASSLSHNSLYLGCFLPYTPLQLMLFSHLDSPIVCTSANISDESIIVGEGELYARLGGVFDFCLDFDRDIVNACDDSVVRVSGRQTINLRLARGYAPSSMRTTMRFTGPVLALGAQQKSTVAIGTENIIVSSAHIGDLFSTQSIDAYKYAAQKLQKLYKLEPKVVVCDQNQAYASSAYAKELGLPVLTVQHHKAHFLAGLYEARLLGSPALGVIFDGTGLGDDGLVWGGEFFIYDGVSIKRVCHVKESLMLGGEITAKEPRRSGLSRLFDVYGEEVLALKCPTVQAFKEFELKALFRMWQSGSNSILSSSAGRLFDAVASHAGIVQSSGYEGEAGLLMESLYDPSIKTRYAVDIGDDINFSQVFLDDTNNASTKVSSFFNTLSFAIGEIADKYSLPVILSGGVFQNSVLCRLTQKELRSRGLKAYFHKNLSPNDSNISVGQAVYANQVQGGKLK
jgi:hydrogenase maturation protein HypF